MTQRAFIERDLAELPTSRRESYGGPYSANFKPLGAPIPCFMWSTARREVTQTTRTAVIEDLRIMFPNGTDVTERDRVAQVTNRKGDVLYAGPYYLQAVRQKEGFIEAALELVKS